MTARKAAQTTKTGDYYEQIVNRKSINNKPIKHYTYNIGTKAKKEAAYSEKLGRRSGAKKSTRKRQQGLNAHSQAVQFPSPALLPDGRNRYYISSGTLIDRLS